jgi:hypothetical protein
VIFAQGALLQQHAAVTVPNDDGKGAMQGACTMRVELFSGAGLVVGVIDEDDLFFDVHGRFLTWKRRGFPLSKCSATDVLKPAV